jgi:hypothetical protein
MSIDTNNNNIVETNVSLSSNESITSSITLISSARRIASDGDINVAYITSSLSYAYSSNGGVTFTTGTLPTGFTFIFYSGSTLWGCSSTTIYYSTNNGVSWTSSIQPMTIRCMAVSFDNTHLYILSTNGSV